MRGTVVVTGASSGIGAATARRLAGEGFFVVAAARRMERLVELAEAVPGLRPVRLDVTDPDSVAALAAAVPDCVALVNNAGGAWGLDPVSAADPGDWQRMYDVNVLGVLRVTQALLPALLRSGSGTIVTVTSTAAHGVYEGGAGYTAAKHAAAAVGETLRLELVGSPVRVCEVAPGMVATEEFSLNRFGGDADRAAAVYRGVPGPLDADDIADAIAWVLTRPEHVNVDLLVVKPRAQAAAHRVHRVDRVD